MKQPPYTHPRSLPFPNGDPRRAIYAVRMQLASTNRKLSPIRYEPYRSARYSGKGRPKPAGPYCCSTYVSIEATCPDSCRFKAAGCYVRAGFTGRMSRQLDDIGAELSGAEVARQEADLIRTAFKRAKQIPQDGARGGRDLRLHVGGDVADGGSARILADAAANWYERDGGAVWLYTHRWSTIRRRAFGGIHVLASVEHPREARKAVAWGYVPAIVVDSFPSGRAYSMPGLPKGWKVLPCPAETRGKTCVECRLCLDEEGLRERKTMIGFQLHGLQRNKVTLPVLRQQKLKGVL